MFTRTLISTHFALRRLAPLALATVLTGTACSLSPTDGTELSSQPSGEQTPLTLPLPPGAEPAPVDSQPDANSQADPVDPTGATVEPAADAEPAPTADETTDTDTDSTEGKADTDSTDTDTDTGGTDSTDSTDTDTDTGSIGKFADLVVTSSELATEIRLGDPVTLVYQGRGTHVTDLLIEIGPSLPAGSSLVVDYGDGSVEQVGSVTAGQAVRVSHAFTPTLTSQAQMVVATVTEPDGTEHRDRLQFSTRARFDLSYSALIVKALNDCDTVGKGDFTVTWNNGRGEGTDSFKLGAGESEMVRDFAYDFGTVVYDQGVPFELDLREDDPWGAWLFAPWKWDGFQFHGTAHDKFEPIREARDHSYTATISSSSDQGVDGDDDCATSMRFRITLDMLDD